MVKKSDRQTAAPLPFTTFGEIAALGFLAQVYCIGCKHWGQIDAADPRWANRRFAGARLRCTQIRYDGVACRSPGQLSIRPADGMDPIVGQQYADLSCGPRDANQLAKLIVGIASGEIVDVKTDNGKNPAAVALGRLGCLKGGKARAKSLSAAKRAAIAKRAALKRWGKD